MKQKRNIWIYPLLILGFLLIGTISCEEDETLADYANKVTGTYTGTVNMVGTGSAPCTSSLSNGSGQTVNLKIEIGSEYIPSFNGIKVSEGGNGSVNLSGTDGDDTLTGRVSGDQLTWTLTGMDDGNNVTFTFSGTK